MSNQGTVSIGQQVTTEDKGFATVIALDTKFTSNMWCISPNAQYIVVLQEDGNFVLYKVIGSPPISGSTSFEGQAIWSLAQQSIDKWVTAGQFEGQALWATGTDGNSGDYFVVQLDGNLVVYNSSGAPIWASNTCGVASIGLYLQNDGNLVLYTGTAEKPVPAWASNTNQ